MNNNCTILYVDDEPLNLQLFELNLEKQFNVLTALSGTEGLKILEENPEICVVVSDMKMPGMSGIDFIKTAKKNYPNLCYFILTGFDITEEIAAAINEKLIIKYFKKPFDVNDIKDTISKSLENYKK